MSIWLEDMTLASPGATPEQQIIDKERWEQLRLMAQTLTAQQREILILRYGLGWKIKQVAAYLEMPENTVSVYVQRIIHRLQVEAKRREKM